MWSTKKAEMGVGTLIVFIAMLLVAAVAAGVLIQTSGSLQEKALATGMQAKSQISTNARTIEVSGSDGRDGNLTDFQQIVKLSPGSDPIKLDQIIFTFNTKDATSTLKYKGIAGICEKNNVDGYNTWNAETAASVSNTQANLAEDLDDDGLDDQIYLTTGTSIWNVSVNISGVGVFSFNSTKNLTLASNTFNDVTATLARDGTTYGTVVISGTQTVASQLTNLVTVTPYRAGEGYFTAIYEQVGINHVPGNMQRGDIIRLCFESPGEIEEDAEVRLNFIPKIGTPTLVSFATPDVITTERVYLYP